jgi:hypothetical protein
LLLLRRGIVVTGLHTIIIGALTTLAVGVRPTRLQSGDPSLKGRKNRRSSSKSKWWSRGSVNARSLGIRARGTIIGGGGGDGAEGTLGSWLLLHIVRLAIAGRIGMTSLRRCRKNDVAAGGYRDDGIRSGCLCRVKNSRRNFIIDSGSRKPLARLRSDGDRLTTFGRSTLRATAIRQWITIAFANSGSRSQGDERLQVRKE